MALRCFDIEAGLPYADWRCVYCGTRGGEGGPCLAVGADVCVHGPDGASPADVGAPPLKVDSLDGAEEWPEE